jgi:hypothetical protein
MHIFGFVLPESDGVVNTLQVLFVVLFALEVVMAKTVATFSKVILIHDILAWISSIICGHFLGSHGVRE